MAKLDETLETIVQRTGSTTGSPKNAADAASFRNGIRLDIAAIVDQLNNVHYPLFNTLSKETQLDALDYGISGNVIFTHVNATAADADAYWDTSRGRTRTLKETVDVLLSEISRLENEINVDLSVATYDDADVRSLIGNNQLNLQQLVKDTQGGNYTLDNDGAADLTYSLSQAIDAIGAFFGGFPGTGNTYAGSYPTLTLAVNLSEVVLDTTIPQSTITSLPTDLSNIRAFTGMTDATDNSPTYSAHGVLTNILDGDDLELAVYKLDAALGSTTGAFSTTANVTSNAPGDPTSDDLVFGSTQLDDDANPAHDARLFFDKSKAALRAGGVAGTQWDDVNRGSYSVAFGQDTQATGAHAVVGGGRENIAAGDLSVIAGGGGLTTGHTIGSGSPAAFIGGGDNNAIGASLGSSFSVITGGTDNDIDGTHSFIGGGINHTIGNGVSAAAYNMIGGGNFNRIAHIGTGGHNVIGGGATNAIEQGNYNLIGGGSSQTISGVTNNSAIVGGISNTISGSINSFIGGGREGVITSSDHSVILGGGDVAYGSSITSAINSSILGGGGHTITASFGAAVIGGGWSNNVSSQGAGVFSGNSNSITDNFSDFSAILSGQNNQITGSEEAVICGGGSAVAGNRNEINKADVSFIGSGEQNQILGVIASNTDYNAIVAGINNVIGDTTNDASSNFIGGGGSNNIVGLTNQAVIVGGLSNSIGTGSAATGSAIVGGASNTVSGSYNFAGGGRYQDISASSYSVVVGGGSATIGEGNTITGSVGSFAGGGRKNDIVTSDYTTIVGGEGNITTASNDYGFMGGGFENQLGSLSAGTHNVVVGGRWNFTDNANFSAILGGDSNSIGSGVNADKSVIAGGDTNSIDADHAFIGGGFSNSLLGQYSVIGGGNDNTISSGGSVNTIVGGQTNIISGTVNAHCFIGGGSNNTVDNSSGGLIVGGGTNVIDISASGGAYNVMVGGFSHEIGDGTGTEAYNFIGGGAENIITGSDYGFIGGGGQQSSANGHLISASDNAAIVGGWNNEIVSTSTYAFIGGGDGNSISGATHGTISGGDTNSVTAAYGTVVGGRENVADALHSTAMGRQATTDNVGVVAIANGAFSAAGDAQTMIATWRRQTTDGTANVELFLDGSGQRFIIDSDSTYMFTIQVVARRTDVDGEGAAYKFEGALDNNAGTTAPLVAFTKTVIHEDDTNYDCDVVANDTNDALQIEVDGVALKTINWVATGIITKVTG